MTDPSVSYERQVLEYAASMLAYSATWALISGGTVPVRAKIVLIDGGDPSVTGQDLMKDLDGNTFAMVPPLAQIALATFIPEEVGVNVFKYSGRVTIGMVVSPPSNYHPSQQSLWATDVFGGVRNDIKAQFGQTGKLARGNVVPDQVEIFGGTDSLPGAFKTKIHIDWRA